MDAESENNRTLTKTDNTMGQKNNRNNSVRVYAICGGRRYTLKL